VIFADSISEALGDHLTRHATEEIAFPTPRGNWLHHSNFRRRIWRPTLRELDLEGWRFHDLRHTYATTLISGGVSPPLVAQMLGHASAAVTLEVYAGFWAPQLETVRLALEA
jgi:integrase